MVPVLARPVNLVRTPRGRSAAASRPASRASPIRSPRSSARTRLPGLVTVEVRDEDALATTRELIRLGLPGRPEFGAELPRRGRGAAAARRPRRAGRDRLPRPHGALLHHRVVQAVRVNCEAVVRCDSVEAARRNGRRQLASVRTLTDASAIGKANPGDKMRSWQVRRPAYSARQPCEFPLDFTLHCQVYCRAISLRGARTHGSPRRARPARPDPRPAHPGRGVPRVPRAGGRAGRAASGCSPPPCSRAYRRGRAASAFVWYWVAVAGVGGLVGFGAAVRSYLFREDDFERRRTRRVMAQFLPCVLAGGLLTVGARPRAGARAAAARRVGGGVRAGGRRGAPAPAAGGRVRRLGYVAGRRRCCSRGGPARAVGLVRSAACSGSGTSSPRSCCGGPEGGERWLRTKPKTRRPLRLRRARPRAAREGAARHPHGAGHAPRTGCRSPTSRGCAT